MRILIGLGLAFAAVACFLWAAFLLLLGRSLYDLLITGVWAPSSLNSYFDHEFACQFGGAWVGWYMLVATAFALLASAACISPVLLERWRR